MGVAEGAGCGAASTTQAVAKLGLAPSEAPEMAAVVLQWRCQYGCRAGQVLPLCAASKREESPLLTAQLFERDVGDGAFRPKLEKEGGRHLQASMGFTAWRGAPFCKRIQVWAPGRSLARRLGCIGAAGALQVSC